MQHTQSYRRTVAQAQVILNAFYMAEFFHFVRTPPPSFDLAPEGIEPLRDRIRSAKRTVLGPDGVPMTRQEYKVAEQREITLQLTPQEIQAVQVALTAALLQDIMTSARSSVRKES